MLELSVPSLLGAAAGEHLPGPGCLLSNLLPLLPQPCTRHSGLSGMEPTGSLGTKAAEKGQVGLWSSPAPRRGESDREMPRASPRLLNPLQGPAGQGGHLDRVEGRGRREGGRVPVPRPQQEEQPALTPPPRAHPRVLPFLCYRQPCPT